MRPSTGIRVGPAGKKGRGVFATKHFLPGDIIERAPMIRIDETEVAPLSSTVLESYWYETDEGDMALGLGFTSLYNHSPRANAVYDVCTGHGTVYIAAHREIKPGTEITINYNGDPNSKTEVKFGLRSSIEEDGDDPGASIHYIDSSNWSAGGWVWCGDSGVPSTREPDLVTCGACVYRMIVEHERLSQWAMAVSSDNQEKTLKEMLKQAVGQLTADGHTLYADAVSEALAAILKAKG